MKIKSLVLLFIASVFCLCSFAQYEDAERQNGFLKENMFVGGNLTLQFSNIYTSVGVSPYVGYSLTSWLDLAASVNFSYTSQRDVYVPGDKVRQTVYGPGAFVRLFPLKFLFAQAHFEQNFIKLKYVQADNSSYNMEDQSLNAHSFLVGGGYAGGRSKDSRSFYYFAVLWDVAGNKYSPYVDYLGRSVPIFRAGYNVAIFQGGKNKD
jgi:hypothetical protein